MNIALSAELEKLIDDKMSSGRYGSPADVIGDALGLLVERDRLQNARYRELKREVLRGVEQLDRGESAPLDMAAIKAKARLERR